MAISRDFLIMRSYATLPTTLWVLVEISRVLGKVIQASPMSGLSGDITRKMENQMGKNVE